ncbi:hypothetical protein GMOD_00006159 [Pyrenophora seminiperda CCB06]|uniref:Uncharacterized protein n=1 Tax=Pyrenophora seminiperda CCB06 TaxID=1302712 RepID=A0A3M7M4Q6_9PLEO|nr:hypothetical protein GMOD_00006159 [Pyrenophora seminiperda CCB06]
MTYCWCWPSGRMLAAHPSHPHSYRGAVRDSHSTLWKTCVIKAAAHETFWMLVAKESFVMRRIICGRYASMPLFAIVDADIKETLFTERLVPCDFETLPTRAPFDLAPAASATLPEGWYYYGCWTYVSGS